MKTKLGIVILAVACGGLAIALFAMKNAADERLKKDADAILDFSNQLVAATANLDELRQVNLMLTNDLAGSRQEALTFSNQFTETSGTAGQHQSLAPKRPGPNRQSQRPHCRFGNAKSGA